MTLVSAICSPGWVGLAADRRITADGTWQADADTKVAAVDGRYLVGYTGDVPITEHERGFERWLHRGLQTLETGDIRTHLVDYLNADDHLRGRPFMLVIVGFAPNAFFASPVAELVVVSNSMCDDGSQRRDNVIHPFRSQRVALRADEQGTIATYGDLVPAQEVMFHMDAALTKSRDLNETTRALIYKGLGDLYGAVSDQSGGTVGCDVLISTLTRPVASAGRGLLQSDFRQGDGKLTNEYHAAMFDSGPTGNAAMLIRVLRDEDAVWGAHPHIPLSATDPGDY